MDGHRKCNLCLTPMETETYQGKCPVCGRKITIGVSHRIEQLGGQGGRFCKRRASNGFEVWFHFRKSSRHAWVFLPEVRRYKKNMSRCCG